MTPRGPIEPLKLAGGRRLPHLLFVTSRAALGRRIGAGGARAVLDGLRAAGQSVYDGLPAPLASPRRALELVRARVAADDTLAGVVLVGGYEVIPAQRIDCLPPRLRSRVTASDDPDGFVVWSDDGYGDLDGDGLPELPVSRVPDGGRAAFLRTVLEVPAIETARSRRGVRNAARPFADRVFEVLPGRGAMRRSSPSRHDDTPGVSLDAPHVYVVLHGLPDNGAAFWGEDGHRHPKAVTVANVRHRPGMVVFTGCCYGALTVDQPASAAGRGAPKSRPPARSMALTFLERGARAFIGCTGLHYSPVQPPYDYFGAPLHEAFWHTFLRGSPPARALWHAKHHYAAEIPHGQARNPVSEAIEFKTFREFTCLGLGW